MNLHNRLVIVGTGCGAVELAFSARASGWEGPITMIGDDPSQPYHRPPLSKAFLSGDTAEEALHLRSPDAYGNLHIELLTGVTVEGIERTQQQVLTSRGDTIPYDHLVLATGGRPRSLPEAEKVGKSLKNLFYLRTKSDADGIKSTFAPGKKIVVIGGGYIGLEVAASAIKTGMNVVVLQRDDRVLSRVAAPELSRFYESYHADAGVKIKTGINIEGLEFSDDNSRVVAVQTVDGERFESDALVVGIGLIPNSELAADAGLKINDGVVVDTNMRTSDEHISALGDCANYYSELYKRNVRIESVPNAQENARKIAAILCGKPPRPPAAPWFWSDQYDLTLKKVGLQEGYDSVVVRGDVGSKNFSIFYMLGNRVLSVDTVNRPVEFNHSKKLVAGRLLVDKAALGDESVALKDIIEASKDDTK
ncbi:NAD(P)/FAD-dependent oxidoreductase [Marinobacter salarius]|uniref:NAD(P)/FAD-dependent oxidoreductase n=1 Tax=Marinobacter salarius TaxID=1420917 RepID=UPI003D0F7739